MYHMGGRGMCFREKSEMKVAHFKQKINPGVLSNVLQLFCLNPQWLMEFHDEQMSVDVE